MPDLGYLHMNQGLRLEKRNNVRKSVHVVLEEIKHKD